MRSACIHTHTHAVSRHSSSNHNTRANKKEENKRERSLRRSIDRELLVGCAAFLFVFSRLCWRLQGLVLTECVLFKGGGV